MNEVGSEKQRFAINYRGSVHDRAIALRDLVLVDDAADRPPLRELIDDLKANYNTADKGMSAIFLTALWLAVKNVNYWQLLKTCRREDWPPPRKLSVY